VAGAVVVNKVVVEVLVVIVLTPYLLPLAQTIQ
jgi:hypothetical protein